MSKNGKGKENVYPRPAALHDAEFERRWPRMPFQELRRKEDDADTVGLTTASALSRSARRSALSQMFMRRSVGWRRSDSTDNVFDSRSQPRTIRFYLHSVVS